MPTTVYTDGACVGNPGPGGWAWAVSGGPYASGAEAASTNQRMEVHAALSALRALNGPVTVVADSRYLVDCFNQRWYAGWERKGWTNSKREPVANQDLWKPLVGLFHARHSELEFQWVKGHSGDPMNDLVDRLAVEAANTQTGRRGDTPPTRLGAPDRPSQSEKRAPAGGASAKASSAGPAAPAGHRVVVFGHRPAELGGYDSNPVAAQVQRRLTDILTGLQTVHPSIVMLTGLGLGTEQLAAEAAAAAGVPYIAVLPFPNQEKIWPDARRAAYQQLVAGAADTLTLSSKQPASRQEAGMAIGRRNDWLVSRANGALVVWDSKDTTIGQTVKALERRIPDDVWIVWPPGVAVH
jgi:ribonuclease HI/uncharacterized phage-like protein YoqJ